MAPKLVADLSAVAPEVELVASATATSPPLAAWFCAAARQWAQVCSLCELAKTSIKSTSIVLIMPAMSELASDGFS